MLYLFLDIVLFPGPVYRPLGLCLILVCPDLYVLLCETLRQKHDILQYLPMWSKVKWLLHEWLGGTGCYEWNARSKKLWLNMLSREHHVSHLVEHARCSDPGLDLVSFQLPFQNKCIKSHEKNKTKTNKKTLTCELVAVRNLAVMAATNFSMSECYQLFWDLKLITIIKSHLPSVNIFKTFEKLI